MKKSALGRFFQLLAVSNDRLQQEKLLLTAQLHTAHLKKPPAGGFFLSAYYKPFSWNQSVAST